jgi:hypothetical protein
MKEVKTEISWGFLELLKTFFDANKLDVVCIERVETDPPRSMVTLSYEENSDTAISITLMSYRHLGFKNMLCDYLIKCGISPSLIAVGKVAIQRDMKKLDEDWEEYRRNELGFK